MKPSHPRQFSTYSIGAIMGQYADPLKKSASYSLPFPSAAASYLNTERSKRYDDIMMCMDEAENRLRTLASIMGMLETDDGTSTAA